MKYQVALRVWNVGEYSLKKDDVVYVEEIGDGMCSIMNVYIKSPITVTIIDLNTHCVMVSPS
jgi:hypothetical protein